MEAFLLYLQSLAQPWLIFLAEDPALRILQSGMLLLGLIVIFLVFFTTRDILLRTHSFFYMFISIVLVAGLPVIGFLLYLLIRPSRTIKERELEEMVMEILVDHRSSSRRQPSEKKAGVKKSKKKDSNKEDISL